VAAADAVPLAPLWRLEEVPAAEVAARARGLPLGSPLGLGRAGMRGVLEGMQVDAPLAAADPLAAALAPALLIAPGLAAAYQHSWLLPASLQERRRVTQSEWDRMLDMERTLGQGEAKPLQGQGEAPPYHWQVSAHGLAERQARLAVQVQGACRAAAAWPCTWPLTHAALLPTRAQEGDSAAGASAPKTKVLGKVAKQAAAEEDEGRNHQRVGMLWAASRAVQLAAAGSLTPGRTGAAKH
jgi:hypothetical protein